MCGTFKTSYPNNLNHTHETHRDTMVEKVQIHFNLLTAASDGEDIK